MGRETPSSFQWGRHGLHPGSNGGSGAAIAPFTALVKKELQEVELGDLKGGEKRFAEQVQWGGFQDQYFLAALIPQKMDGTELILKKISDTAAELRMPAPRPPFLGTQFSSPTSCSWVQGSRYPQGLRSGSGQGAGLRVVRHRGQAMLWAMKFSYQYLGNYGLAIIILTILIKIIFFYPTHLSMKSMSEMKKLQPEMAKMRRNTRTTRRR